MMKNSRLNIVAGESIPFITEAFDSIGNIRFLPGREISPTDIHDTDILLVRSITKINEALLKGSSVQFVGSASAGTDHIDKEYLKAQNIGFASAAGSNANSVAEYVVAVLLRLARQFDCSLQGKTIGIIGVGHIGKRVKAKAEALGMRPILNDPPLAELGLIDHHDLKEVLGCDVATLHTPLTTDGPHPTFHLLNERTMRWVKPGAWFINAARGEVVDTPSLWDAIRHNRLGPTVLDVWENEPHIDWDLFQAVTLGTPHIAGHSLDGKANGTYMIYKAVCHHFGIDPIWDPTHTLPSPLVPRVVVDQLDEKKERRLEGLIKKVYDVESDSLRMAELLKSPPEERPALFDALRKNYPVRREFHRTLVECSPNMLGLRQTLVGLGFTGIP